MNEPEKLKPHQQRLLRQALTLMKKALPETPLDNIVDIKLMLELLDGQLEDKNIFHSGAFCVYWGKDPKTGEYVGLLHHRKEKHKNGKCKLGAVGGYTDDEEISVYNARRETIEEIRKADNGLPDGLPVFTPLEGRYAPIMENRDIERFPRLQYAAYAYELLPENIEALQAHIRQCQEDKRYWKESIIASKKETSELELLPLSHIVHYSPDDFASEAHYHVFCEVARRCGIDRHTITPVSEGVKIAPTVGDMPIFMQIFERNKKIARTV